MSGNAAHPQHLDVIDVFADISCPFTHVGLLRLVERRDRISSHAVVHVKAWPLELVNGEPLAGSVVAEEVAALRAQVAPDLFAGFDAGAVPTTTIPALALAAAAYRVDPELGERVSLDLRHALFEEGRDVASEDVLGGIAAAHGVRPESAERADVIAEWHEGQRRGVEGSPYFFAGNRGFFCPSLDIRHEGDHFEISRDEAGLQRFLDAAFS